MLVRKHDDSLIMYSESVSLCGALGVELGFNNWLKNTVHFESTGDFEK